MGQRSNTETIVAILKAFLDQRTWKQADLARHVGVSAATVHKRLGELSANNIPLTAERDHPHVYWSVPKSWYPGGVLFTGDQVETILRLLSRLPASKARDNAIESILKIIPKTRVPNEVVLTPEITSREEQYLPLIEDAASKKQALKFRYFTATTGKESVRHASVARVMPGAAPRFVAVCHRSNTLKWFRVEGVSDARLDAAEPYRKFDADEVDAYVRSSLGGFHGGGAPVAHEFFVSDPEARWVQRNLQGQMTAEEVPGGIRVTVETAALDRVASYVVGLGAAAKPLTPALRDAVAALARGALDSIGKRAQDK